MRFARRPARLKQVLMLPFAQSHLAAPDRVLLTFDDGPHPVHTPAVLERLRSASAIGAFFLIGERLAASPDLLRLIEGEGHFVGNHTFTHPQLGWSHLKFARKEVERCQELLSKGAEWFRPPYGRLTPGLWWAARRLGLKVVTWTLDSGDWQCRNAHDAKRCAAEVLKLVRPGDTILFHDNHEWIIPILNTVLASIPRLWLNSQNLTPWHGDEPEGGLLLGRGDLQRATVEPVRPHPSPTT